jgi:hypothetical protein
MTVAVPQLKERVRDPNLAILVKRADGVPMEEALAKGDEAGLVIASNKRLSKALVGSDEWRDIREVFACWTGTMTAYDKPDQKLGKIIDYTNSDTGVRYVFPVPEEQQGKKNVILVAEHPNVSLVKDGNDRIVQATEVDVVERFPTSKEGWFLGDQKYDIPQGDKVDGSNQDARYLWRIGKRVGLVARGDYYYYGDCNYRRNVSLGNAPSVAFGVATEATEGGAPKKLQVEAEPKGNGIVISGVTLDEFRALVGNVDASISELSQMVKPEKLEAIRLLVQALEIKG